MSWTPSSTLGAVGMGTTMLGGLTSALGSIFQGQSQQQMYNYQAGVARLNQQIAEQNAVYAEQVGEQQATQAGLQGAQRLGQIKVAQASSGLDIRSGSAAQVQQSQKLVTAMDLATIRSNAAKTAYNYRVTGVQYGAQAGLDTVSGQNAMTSGFIGASSSILGAASSVSSQWLRGQQLGLWQNTQPNLGS